MELIKTVDVVNTCKPSWSGNLLRKNDFVALFLRGAYFAVSDAKSEISPWNSRLQVTSRGYMLGYNDLRDPSVSGLFRFLARTGDRIMKMQIVRICFGQR